MSPKEAVRFSVNRKLCNNCHDFDLDCKETSQHFIVDCYYIRMCLRSRLPDLIYCWFRVKYLFQEIFPAKEFLNKGDSIYQRDGITFDDLFSQVFCFYCGLWFCNKRMQVCNVPLISVFSFHVSNIWLFICQCNICERVMKKPSSHGSLIRITYLMYTQLEVASDVLVMSLATVQGWD